MIDSLCVASIPASLAALAFAVGGCSAGEPGVPAEARLRPNLVLVVLDDVGREGLASYGGDAWSTPHLDRLAADGMVFDHFYSTPVCGDSRAQLATGQYTFRTGLARHALDPALAPPAREGAGPDTRLARLLRERGYATIFAGKKHVPRALRETAGPSDLVPVIEAEGWERHAWALANLQGKKQPKYWGGSVLRDGVLERLPAKRYTPDYLFSFVEEQIAAAARDPRPFFLQYGLLLAHGPHEPTPLTRARSPGGVARFPDLVFYLDRLLGRLVAALEAAGEGTRTLVLVVSDNGSTAGVRAALLGREAGGGKRHLSDAGTRVPALAWWPGVVAAARNPNLVDLTDVLPTFVALADGVLAGRPVTPPPGLDGQSFARQLVGELDGGRSWQFGQFDEGGTHYYMRDLRWKLYQDGRLFDLESDPRELRPLLPGAEPAEAARARGRLRRRLVELNPRFAGAAAPPGRALSRR
ncbi:MAG: sulfatase-like hydrolase/transferase [Myxococcota bacterium]|nr:sulfatase-like hydrolase/transferase [Myxococcota bacterium]